MASKIPTVAVKFCGIQFDYNKDLQKIKSCREFLEKVYNYAVKTFAILAETILIVQLTTKFIIPPAVILTTIGVGLVALVGYLIPKACTYIEDKLNTALQKANLEAIAIRGENTFLT